MDHSLTKSAKIGPDYETAKEEGAVLFNVQGTLIVDCRKNKIRKE